VTNTDLRRYAWLSVGAAVCTIALKGTAAAITGSVSLLSDAAESVVNLAGALFALWMLSVAQAPPDEEHNFGHGKAEYFSAAFEGVLIGIAAALIAVAAIMRLITPAPLASLDVGLAASAAATVINLVVARVLLRVGRAHGSLALVGDGKHLMTDVVTSVGVIVGLAAAHATGAVWLDPVIALAVAAHIAKEATGLVRQATDGLMDRALPDDELAIVRRALAAIEAKGAQTKGLRTRQAGRQRFIAVEVQVPGAWSVERGHALLDELEEAIARELTGAVVVTHLAPLSETVPTEPHRAAGG